MAQQLAVVRRPGFGMRDFHEPGLWFETYIHDSVAALQCFHGEEALRIIKESGVHDVPKLDGRVAWVNVEGNSIKFLRWCKA